MRGLALDNAHSSFFFHITFARDDLLVQQRFARNKAASTPFGERNHLVSDQRMIARLHVSEKQFELSPTKTAARQTKNMRREQIAEFEV